MAIFSLTDINFNKGVKRLTGPGSALIDSNYKYDILRYPIDIGNYDKGHYIVIHINTQRKTQFRTSPTGDNPTVITNFTSTKKNQLNDIFNTETAEQVKKVLGKIIPTDRAGQLGVTVSDFFENLKQPAFLRTIQRTSETIALYMPETLNFIHNQQYSDISLGGGLGAAALTAGVAIEETIRNINSSNALDELSKLGGNLAPVIASLFANQTDLGRVFFAAGAGVVQNPLLEILYTSPEFRSFRFDFLLYPRDEKEAKEVQKILETLKFHQAPEIDTTSKGFFLVPPSEFDIKFYYNGKENPNIPKISTCVLQSIDIDYAPNGFSAYEIPNQLTPTEGGTGMPVAIRLSLQFKETEILTKENYRSKKSEPYIGVSFPNTPGVDPNQRF